VGSARKFCEQLESPCRPLDAKQSVEEVTASPSHPEGSDARTSTIVKDVVLARRDVPRTRQQQQ